MYYHYYVGYDRTFVDWPQTVDIEMFAVLYITSDFHARHLVFI